MKKLIHIGAVLLFTASLLTSCITVNDYGPPGRDGRAYFGIDYDWGRPYSYWDNNPSVPIDPYFGEYYRTSSGRYNFEYFINYHEYWFGTYEIWINRGEQGQDYGKPGRDGRDNYLMLICNPDGFYFDRWSKGMDVTTRESGDQLIIEGTSEEAKFRIEMTRTTRDKRAPQEPKYIQQK